MQLTIKKKKIIDNKKKYRKLDIFNFWCQKPLWHQKLKINIANMNIKKKSFVIDIFKTSIGKRYMQEIVQAYGLHYLPV